MPTACTCSTFLIDTRLDIRFDTFPGKGSSLTPPRPPDPTRPRRHAGSRHLQVAKVLALGLGFTLAQVQVQAQAQASTTAPPASASAATARGDGGTAPGAQAGLDDLGDLGDRRFVAQAATSGKAEVLLGQLARQRATSAEVKQYAERMVRDHTEANDQLPALAKARGIALPATTTPAQQQMHDGMDKLDRAEFDQLYLSRMLGDHRKAVALFQKQARSGEDAALKAFAAKTLPTLQAHLKMAATLYGNVQRKH